MTDTTTPRFYRDSQSREIAVVPVGHGKHCTLLKPDYERLRALGVSETWGLSGDGKGRFYVSAYHTRAYSSAGRVSVARLILDLRGGERCFYRSRDRLDLRPENLAADSGFAKGRGEAAVFQVAA
ncbi:hypothetical protein JOD31_001052 [Methylopila capsulata]|uniref:Uncharacterized protein n=1 Tax=Methylopila capsulata TaxID=61654 RepID=A0A9W6IV28_9HYPH|nr:hypothetical protein [Methylopila capsulata]MBM7850840.1 hypothetical protein [Methylopila capsulata]GLK56134.1 hypothetical protein GCM10008170_21530 [Methylopila capsulata]